jgi:uncharacterized protein Yka (UPF0111/DUF47 family)
MSPRLIPRERAFYDLFRDHVAIVVEAARALEVDLREFVDPAEASTTLRQLERRGDDVNHAIMGRLAETFVPPFDRHQVQELAGLLDDIIDLAEEVAHKVVLYGLTAPPAGASDQAQHLVLASEVLAEAIDHLERPIELRPYPARLHQIERRGDVIVRTNTKRLFEGATDVRPVLIGQEIYGALEDAIDRTDHAGQVLERIASAYASSW